MHYVTFSASPLSLSSRMEKLSLSINNVVLQRTWNLIHISNADPQLSHLLYADDVLLFTKAINSQFRFITDLFDRFSRASRLNLSKSRVFYSTGTPQDKINRLTSLTRSTTPQDKTRSTTSLDKYLGFPVLKGRAK
jgi:hypothetical protein